MGLRSILVSFVPAGDSSKKRIISIGCQDRRPGSSSSHDVRSHFLTNTKTTTRPASQCSILQNLSPAYNVHPSSIDSQSSKSGSKKSRNFLLQMATDQSASRAARRQLAEHLRDNWTWPPTFTPLETDEDPIVKATLTRERYYSSYSSEDEDETPISNPSTAAATVGLEKREHARTMSDPYRFEGPDAVGPELKKETESKRRRRWREEAEEMTWNEGLRCWIERRDYWTGATGVRRRAVGVSTMHGTNGHAIAAQVLESYVSQPSDPGSHPERKGNPHRETSTTAESRNSTASTNSNLSVLTISTPPSSISLPHPSTSTDLAPLIPLVPPLLPPTNSLRAQINPALYPEIYTKVVLSSRTPSVPINLADMTRALVQGWKDDGEWPPKPSIPEPVIAGKRGKLARRVVPGMRGEVGEGGQGAVASREKHPHVKRGVESVKRAFRLSGSGSGERSEEKLGD